MVIMVPSDEELRRLWNDASYVGFKHPEKDTTKEVGLHILDMAEKHLEAQLKVGLAANIRAGILCGLFLMSAFVIAAFGLLYKETSWVYLAAIALFSFSSVVASLLCYLAMRPVPWNKPGRTPEKICNVETYNDNWAETLFYECWNRQKCIDDNNKVTARCTHHLKYGVRIGYFAIFCSIITIAIRYIALVGTPPL